MIFATREAEGMLLVAWVRESVAVAGMILECTLGLLLAARAQEPTWTT